MSNAAGVLAANLAPAEKRTPEARVAGAMSGFAKEIGALSAFRLESCIHCGICADACHFYIATEDPQYTPIWKVDLSSKPISVKPARLPRSTGCWV